MSFTVGASQSTALGEVVPVPVPLLGPYGVRLESDELGKCAIIRAWERLPDGRIGPIQKHGGVRIGDVLIALNDTPFHHCPFQEVLRILRSDNLLKKTLYFAPREELIRRRGQRSALMGAVNPSKSSPFVSQIRRARVNQERGAFAEYEVACCFRTTSTQLQKEKIYKWSVWRRYSQFEALDSELRKTLGWQIGAVTFPPKHPFVMDKLSRDFLENRSQALDAYWQKVMSIDRITEFHMHHCSKELKEFLELESWITSGGEVPQGGPAVEVLEAEAANNVAATINNNRLQRRPSGVGGRRPLRVSRNLNTQPRPSGTNIYDYPSPSTLLPSRGSPSTVGNPPMAYPPTTTVGSTSQQQLPPPPPPPHRTSYPPQAPTKHTMPPVSGARANLLEDIKKLKKA